MKMTDTSPCETCGSLSSLPNDAAIENGSSNNSSDSHSCLKTLITCVQRNTDTLTEQGDTIKSQNILIAKLIRELEELKERMEAKDKEVGSLNERMEKVILSQAHLCVEPEHKSLIDRLKQDGFIVSDRVYQIMLSVDFKDFSQDSVTPNKSYQINKAKFFEKYVQRVKEGSRVLYMFSNPYVAVCLALIVGPEGIVVTEGDDQTVAQVRKTYPHLIETKRLLVIDGKWSDFLAKGWSSKAPYDVIIVPKNYYNQAVESQLGPNGTAYDPWDDSRLNEGRTTF